MPVVAARRDRSAARWSPLAMRVAILGLVLVVAGALVALWPSVETVEPVLGSGNRPIDAGAADFLDITAHNSPAVAANPTDPDNVAVAARIDSPKFSCAVFMSFDRGRSWAQTDLDVPAHKSISCFAPDVAFDAEGVLHLAFTSFADVPGHGNVPDAVWVASSRDGGRSFSAPVEVGPQLAFHLRLAAAPDEGGHLYLAWLKGRRTGGYGFTVTGNPILVSSSTDGGDTWSDPVRANDPGRVRVVAPAIAAAPGGVVDIAFLDLGDDDLDYLGAHEGRGGPPYPGDFGLVFARSEDGGRTWQETVVDEHLVPAERVMMLFPPAPSLALGNEEEVLIAFHDARHGDPDVWVWRSGDGGDTFGEPVRVNDTRVGDGSSQHLPAVDTAPGGRIDVVYYDRRTDPDDEKVDVSLQSSNDGGVTFGPRLRLTDRSFDAGIGYGAERGLPQLGSRLGLHAWNHGALAVWSDTRAGNPGTGKQNLGRALVSFEERGRGRRPALGGALAATGGIFAAGPLFVRRGRRDMTRS